MAAVKLSIYGSQSPRACVSGPSRAVVGGAKPLRAGAVVCAAARARSCECGGDSDGPQTMTPAAAATATAASAAGARTTTCVASAAAAAAVGVCVGMTIVPRRVIMTARPGATRYD